MDASQGLLEAEMNMFEQQIGGAGGAPGPGTAAAAAAPPAAARPPVIAANTYTSVQDKLSKIASEGYGGAPAAAAAAAPRPPAMFLPHQLTKPAGPTPSIQSPLPPPPPPPPPVELAGGGGGLVPPPPPPPPGYMQPFGPGPAVGPPAGFVPPPPGYVRGPGPPPGWRGPMPGVGLAPPPPPRPVLAAPVISAGPKVYASKPQLKRPAAEEEAPVAPATSSASSSSAATITGAAAAAAAAKKSKAAAMAERVAASVTTVVDGDGGGSSGGSGGGGGGGGSSGSGGGGGKHQSGNKKQKRPKRFIRTAGGQIWEDQSLHDWDKDDFRIFAGDLGNDVTEDVLTRYFSVYPSFIKAKVVRDKRSNKTKGYGFISFRESDDYVRAMKEMNGKYVGSRPIKLRKSQWRDRQIDVVRKKQKERAAFGLL